MYTQNNNFIKLGKNSLVIFLIGLLIFSTMNKSVYGSPEITADSISQNLNIIQNRAFGLLSGNHQFATQIYTTDYAANLYFVKEGNSNYILAMENSDIKTKVVQNSGDTTNSYYVYNYETGEVDNLPTFVIADNQSNTAPNVTLTSTVFNLGYLSLTNQTVIKLQPSFYYIFNITFSSSEIYDLNMESTGLVHASLIFNDTEMIQYAVNGWTRDHHLVYPYFEGNNSCYLAIFTESINYLTINPVKLESTNIQVGDFITRNYQNEPDSYYNETRDDYVPNKNKNTIHIYTAHLESGDYQINYESFDDTINSELIIFGSFGQTSGNIQETGGAHYYHIEQNSTITMFVTGKAGEEFDYALSIDPVIVPTVPVNEAFLYYGTGIMFKFELNKTSIVYFNGTETKNTVKLTSYKDSEIDTWVIFNIGTSAQDATKMLLEPGEYYVYYESTTIINMGLKIYAIESELFSYKTTNTLDFTLENTNGLPINYKLVKIEQDPAELINFNFTLLSTNNYTVELKYMLFVGRNLFSIDTSGTFTLANRQYFNLTGNNETTTMAFGENSTQVMNLYSSVETSTKYLLIWLEGVYNNTEDNKIKDKDVQIFNKTEIELELDYNSSYIPEAFVNHEIVQEEMDIGSDGEGTYEMYINGTTNSDYLLVFKTTLLGNTWYNVTFSFTNCSFDFTLYDLLNNEQRSDSDISLIEVNGQYYSLEQPDFTFFNSKYYNTSLSFMSFEFGTYGDKFLIMLPVLTYFENCTIEITFTPYEGSVLQPVELSKMEQPAEPEEPEKKINTGLIIGLSIGGGALVIGGAVTTILLKKRR